MSMDTQLLTITTTTVSPCSLPPFVSRPGRYTWVHLVLAPTPDIVCLLEQYLQTLLYDLADRVTGIQTYCVTSENFWIDTY